MPPPAWTEKEYQEALYLAGSLEDKSKANALRARIQEYEAAQDNATSAKAEEDKPWYESALPSALAGVQGLVDTIPLGASIAQALPVGGDDTGIERTYSADPTEGLAESIAQTRQQGREQLAESWAGQGLQSGAGWMLPTERMGAQIAQAIPADAGPQATPQGSLARSYSGDPSVGTAENLAQVNQQAQADDPWKFGLTALASAVPSSYLMARAGSAALEPLAGRLGLNPLLPEQWLAQMARSTPAALAGGTAAGGHEHAMGSATPMDTYGERFAEAAPTAAATALVGHLGLSGLRGAGQDAWAALRSGDEGLGLRQVENAGGGTRMIPGRASIRKPPAVKEAERSALRGHEAGELSVETPQATILRESSIAEKLQEGFDTWWKGPKDPVTGKRVGGLKGKMAEESRAFYASPAGQRKVSIDPAFRSLMKSKRALTSDSYDFKGGRLVAVRKPLPFNKKIHDTLDDTIRTIQGLNKIHFNAKEFDQIVKGLDDMIYEMKHVKKSVPPQLREVEEALMEGRRQFGADYVAMKDRHHQAAIEHTNRTEALFGTPDAPTEHYESAVRALRGRIGNMAYDDDKLMDLAKELGLEKELKDIFGAKGMQVLQGQGARIIASQGGAGAVGTFGVRNLIGQPLDPTFRLLRQYTPAPFYPSTAIGVGQERLQKEKADTPPQTVDTLMQVGPLMLNRVNSGE